MASEYNQNVFGPNKNGQSYTGDTNTAFPDKINDLIRDGIIQQYANLDNFTDENYKEINYASGGPSAISKL